MAETLFAFDKHNYTECQSAYRGDNNQEYYLGEYSIEAGSVIDVRADKKSVGACSVIRLSSRTRLKFKRTWHHIRKDGTDVVVLWFVKRGSLSICHSGGFCTARPGDFALSKSMTPFSIECEVDENARHEVLHVLVPAHVFRRYITRDVTTGFSVAAEGRCFDIVQNLLTHLLEDAGELTDDTAERLLDSALATLADGIKDCENLVAERQTIADRRLQEVMRYVENHLSDSTLSTAAVARACGISPRYMSLLLKQQGTSFKELVWDKRLKIARRWLSTTQPGEISIAEIAFRVGFKSPAHFSRMFKRVYDKGPRDFRADCMDGQLDGQQDIYSTISSNSVQ